MEQMLQNEPTELSVQAVPQKAVEQACFHALTLISRNCEYLDQHLARTGADQESRQAVTDISAASAQLDRTVNEVMTLLEYLRAEELPRLYPMDLCDLLQQIAAQADMVQEQLKVELTLDYGGWTTCHVLAERSDAELLLLHLLSNALRACSEGGKVQIVLRRSESFWQLTLLDNGCGLPRGFSLAEAEGVGFSIVTSIVSSLHGAITCHVQQGTEIIISFPRPLITPIVARDPEPAAP